MRPLISIATHHWSSSNTSSTAKITAIATLFVSTIAAGSQKMKYPSYWNFLHQKNRAWESCTAQARISQEAALWGTKQDS